MRLTAFFNESQLTLCSILLILKTVICYLAPFNKIKITLISFIAFPSFFFENNDFFRQSLLFDSGINFGTLQKRSANRRIILSSNHHYLIENYLVIYVVIFQPFGNHQIIFCHFLLTASYFQNCKSLFLIYQKYKLQLTGFNGNSIPCTGLWITIFSSSAGVGSVFYFISLILCFLSLLASSLFFHQSLSFKYFQL